MLYGRLFIVFATLSFNLNILKAYSEKKITSGDKDSFPDVFFDTLIWRMNNNWCLLMEPVYNIPLFNPIDGYLIQTGLKTTFNPRKPFELYFKPRYAFNRKIFYAEAEVSSFIYKNEKNSTQIHLSGGNFLTQVNHPFIKNEQIFSIINLLEGKNPLLYIEKKYLKFAFKQTFSPFNITATSTFAQRNYSENQIFQRLKFSPNNPLWSYSLRDKSFTNSISFTYTPLFSLTYKKGIADFLKSESNFDYLEMAISKSFNFKEKVSIDFNYISGKFLNQEFIHFNDFYHFPTGRTLKVSHPVVTTYRLLDYYNFSTKNYFHRIHLQVQTTDFLLSKLNFIKKFNIMENLFFNLAVTENKAPFLEIGYALDYILEKFRLEIVIGRFEETWLGPRIILGPVSL